MNTVRLICAFVLVMVFATGTLGAQSRVGPKHGGQWRALHLIGYGSDADLEVLGTSRGWPRWASTC